MKMNAQAQILEMIRSRGRVKTSEILREVKVTTPAKCMLRLRKKYPIENISGPGEEAVYCWFGPQGQMRLI